MHSNGAGEWFENVASGFDVHGVLLDSADSELHVRQLHIHSVHHCFRMVLVSHYLVRHSDFS